MHEKEELEQKARCMMDMMATWSYSTSAVLRSPPPYPTNKGHHQSHTTYKHYQTLAFFPLIVKHHGKCSCRYTCHQTRHSTNHSASLRKHDSTPSQTRPRPSYENSDSAQAEPKTRKLSSVCSSDLSIMSTTSALPQSTTTEAATRACYTIQWR